MRRINLLFILHNLTQTGTARYLYELCRVIDRDRFSISILTWEKSRPSDYFRSRIEALGIPIHARWRRITRLPLDVIPIKRRTYKLRSFIQRGLDWLDEQQQNVLLGSFLRTFDIIAVVQFENYLALQHVLACHPNVAVHILSELFQYDYNPYLRFEPRRYRFVMQHPLQLEYLRGTACEGAEAIDFPLPLSFEGRSDIYTYPLDAPPRIAVFIRFDPQRPFDALLYAFQSVVAKRPEVKLHLFGGGDRAPVERLARLLNIEDRVVFEGHTSNIADSISAGRFHLVWMNSVGPHVGYSSVEVSSYGVPIVFWNIHSSTHEEVCRMTGGAVEAYSTVPEIVEATLSLLGDERRLRALGASLRAHLCAEHEPSGRIRKLEDFYAKMLEGGKAGAATSF